MRLAWWFSAHANVGAVVIELRLIMVETPVRQAKGSGGEPPRDTANNAGRVGSVDVPGGIGT